jgi:sulfhydrogenase subunit beta (sulfur reductase)
VNYILPNLRVLMELLSEKGVVYGPVGDERVVFDRLDGREPNLSSRSDVSPRNLFQPMTHYFLRFEDRPSAEVDFSDFDTSPRVVIGMRPCDVAGLDAHDRVFAASESYRALRDATAIVGVLCGERGTGCFCDSMGGGPHESQGMDIALYLTDDGYVVSAITERGEALLEDAPFKKLEDAPEPPFEEHEHPSLDTEGIVESLEKLEAIPSDERPEIWDDIAFSCVNCRVCTYTCPTCHCFTVTDEVLGVDGGRAAVWDSCQNKLFTKEASGHNPRESKVSRVRQRILHKYLYYPRVHGALMCSGCGRCIAGCPTGRSIVEELTTLKEVARS